MMGRSCCRCCSSSSLLSLLLLMVVFLLPAADASFLPTPNVQGLFVNGTLCCGQDGSCPGSGPLAGVTVTLNCKNTLAATVVGQNITDANGTFSITVPAASRGSLALLSPSLACVVDVPLPAPSSTVCTALSTTSGTIVGLLQTVGTVTSQTLGLLQALLLLIPFTFNLPLPPVLPGSPTVCTCV